MTESTPSATIEGINQVVDTSAYLNIATLPTNLPLTFVEYAGPAFFGYCLDVILYGVLTAQIYLYYLAFPNDKKATKAIVCFVYTVGSIQTAFALHDFFVLFGGQFGVLFHGPTLEDLPDIHLFGFTWLTVPLSSALVAVTVQLFYAHCIYIISHIKTITAIVSILALLQLGCGIFVSVTVYNGTVVTVSLSSSSDITSYGFEVNAIAWGLVGALCDWLIAIFMFVYISKQTKRTSKVTQKSLVKIKQLLLETGFLTGIAATAHMGFSFLLGDSSPNTLFMVPGLILSKLYSNSMLAVLNNRLVIEKGRYATRPLEISFYEPDFSVTTT